MAYKVMIVEDDPLIRQGLGKMIFWEECGLELTCTASNGREALQRMEDSEVDICITDIKMPQMDGIAFMKNCKAMGKAVSFIVLSGFAEFELVKEAVQIGIENYLVKPIDKEELIQTLVTVVDKLDARQKEQLAAEEGIRIFRENLLYRWITGNITYEEWKDRKEYLHYALGRDYVAGILKLFPARQGELEARKAALLAQLRIRLESSGKGATVLDTNGNLLMLFRDAVQDRRQVEYDLQKLVEYVECEGNFRPFVVMGTVVRESRDVEKSYYSARFLLENYELCTPRKIWWYQEADRNIEGISNAYYDKLVMLTDKFQFNDRDEIFRILDTVIADVRHVPGIRMETLQAFAMLLLNRILYNMKKYRPNTEGQILALQSELSAVFRFSSPEKMVEWMKAVVDQALEISGRAQYNKTIAGVLYYLDGNYHKDICIKTVAEAFDMNQVYLGRIFRQEIGSTFTEYLNLLRLKKARELLQDSELSVQQIAEAVGYKNSNYFYVLFKKQEGMTPSEYRNQIP